MSLNFVKGNSMKIHIKYSGKDMSFTKEGEQKYNFGFESQTVRKK